MVLLRMVRVMMRVMMRVIIRVVIVPIVAILGNGILGVITA